MCVCSVAVDVGGSTIYLPTALGDGASETHMIIIVNCVHTFHNWAVSSLLW